MMKQAIKTYSLLAFLLIGHLSFAQNFKTSGLLSVGIPLYYSNNSDFHNSIVNNGSINFCFSGALREEFQWHKFISLNMELDYSYGKGNFISPAPPLPMITESALPETHSNFRHIIAIQSFDIPFIIKIKTDTSSVKGTYFNIGAGLSYLFHSTRIVDIITTYDFPTQIVDITPLTQETGTLKNNNVQIGSIGILGFGKNFLVKDKIVFCELNYRFDLNQWTYPDIAGYINSFDIKRQYFQFNLGMVF